MDVVALVTATGRSGRTGSAVSGAWMPVHGEPLLRHAVRRLVDTGCVHHVFVGAHPSEGRAAATAVTEWPATVVECPVVECPAGPPDGTFDEDRAVSHMLSTALDTLPQLAVVLVHDALRAFAPPALIRSVVDTVRDGASSVTPVLPVADTIKHVDADGMVIGTRQRDGLRATQSPRGFAAHMLRRAHSATASALNDPAVPVHTIPGHPYAAKLASSFDLAAAEAVFATDEHVAAAPVPNRPETSGRSGASSRSGGRGSR